MYVDLMLTGGVRGEYRWKEMTATHSHKHDSGICDDHNVANAYRYSSAVAAVIVNGDLSA